MFRSFYLTGFIVIIGFCVAMGAAPAKQVKPRLIVHNDSTIISRRYFDKAALKNYSAQKEFQYSDGYVGELLWSRFWRWFWSLFDVKERKTATGLFFIIAKYLLLGLGLAAVIFLILKLVGVDALNVIRRKSLTLPYDEAIENIYEADLDAEIEKAMAQQNYRFAVRLLYLRCLKQLSDADLIKWDINKTNNTYANELTNAEQRIAFKALTRQFEYVWYGEFIIDAQVFSKINALFGDFKVRGI